MTECWCSTCRSSIRAAVGTESLIPFRIVKTSGAKVNATSLPFLAVEAPTYVTLQREMHDALLVQHPEWIQSDGICPTCDEYDRRFAELLSMFLGLERAQANYAFKV
jgi:hypothetical protein